MKVNKITRALSQLILCTLFLSCGAQVKTIPFSDKAIRYEGRVGFTTDAAVLSWSGNAVTIWFKGTGISAILQDSDTANYYNVVVDDKSIVKIHTDTERKKYILASGLLNANHKLQLFKRTEWAMGKTFFYGFETLSNTMILAPEPLPNRKIEFYGNSIT